MYEETYLKALKHLPYSNDIKLSVINNEDKATFESKGGNREIYYEIKTIVNDVAISLINLTQGRQ